MHSRELELYQTLLAQKRLRGLDDLYFFNKHIVETNPDRRTFLVPHVHGEWSSWYKASKARIKLILVPRATFKSTFFTVGKTLQDIARNRDERILIANATQTNAQNFLFEIKDHLTKNQTFLELYTSYQGKETPFYNKRLRWNENEIELDGRSLGIKEATISTIGVGGNLVSQHYCLYPETLVFTSNGYLRADELRRGIRVLSHDGRFHSILAVSKSNSSKKISIRSGYQSEYASFSPNHRIYVYRDGNFRWIEAGMVKKTDKVCVPLTNKLNRQPSKINDRINRLLTEPDMWRLIGYWLAEGCHTKEGGQIRMTFSHNELDYVRDVERIVTTHLKVRISYRKTKSSTYIICFSDNDFKEIVKKFGTKSYTKHIPPLFLNNVSSKQLELVRGYFRGDGNYCGITVGFSSTSLSLLTGIQLILAKHGIASGICYGNKEGNGTILGNRVHIRNSWVLASTSHDLKLILGLKTKYPTKPIRSFFTDNYWVVPIQDIKVADEQSYTYDIQVQDTETLCCPGMIVHNSRIVADDLVNLENSSTRYQALKVIDWWKKAFSLLDYDGEMVVIGTRWSYFELYSWMLEQLGEKVDSYIRGAYKSDGSLYFPEVLNEEKLRELRSIQGSFTFSSFYLNNPVDEETAIIKQHQVRYYGEREEKALPKNLSIFSVCDPAVSQEEGADYSSIVTVGIDYDDNWYVLEVFRGQWTVGELVLNLFFTFLKWKPITMSIEIIGQAQALMNPIYAEEEKRAKDGKPVYLPLVEIKSRPPYTKEMRIRSVLQPRFERGKIFIRRDMTDLEEELLRFPKSAHDDIIDPLTDLEEIGFTPNKEATDEKQDTFETQTKLRPIVATGKVTDEVMGEHY